MYTRGLILELCRTFSIGDVTCWVKYVQYIRLVSDSGPLLPAYQDDKTLHRLQLFKVQLVKALLRGTWFGCHRKTMAQTSLSILHNEIGTFAFLEGITA